MEKKEQKFKGLPDVLSESGMVLDDEQEVLIYCSECVEEFMIPETSQVCPFCGNHNIHEI